MNITLSLRKGLLTVFIGVSCCTATATELHANSNTGSDTTGDGSESAPYLSFYKAYSEAANGDTLLLDGTFDWTSSAELGDIAVTGFSLLKNLTIIGQEAGSTFIQAASTSNTADRCVFTVNQDVSFQNLTIRYGYNVNQAHNAGGITVMDDVRNNIITIDNCSIEHNRIDNGVTTNYYIAGGIYLRGNTSFHPNVTITNTTFHHNSANGKAYGAGALYSMQSNIVTTEGCTFHDNSGTDGSNFGVGYHNIAGAMGFFRFNTVKVTNCTFTANTAETSGGAILSWYNYTYLTNNTIAWNTVTSASGKGGGVYVVFMQQSPGKLFLKNNIIANNTVNSVDDDLNFNTDSWQSSIFDNGNNIVESATGSSIVLSGTGTVTGNQSNLNLSSSLADNENSNGVQTLAISPGSIAIDAGNYTDNGAVSVPLLDQRQGTRDAAPDIGAFEHGVTLPVELLEFNASLTSSGTVALDWTTASENNNDRFELYRSVDGETWELFHSESGIGFSTQTTEYSAEDRDAILGVNYYKLKQVDFDGNSRTFEPVMVSVDGGSTVKLFPNPANSFLTLTGVKRTSYRVLSATGLVLIEKTDYVPGQVISLERLMSGSYLLEIDGEYHSFIKLD